MSIAVGEVIAVYGKKITLRVFEDNSKDTLYFKGDKYKGVSIREYISIQRGFRNIICIIEGEYLDEKRYEEEGHNRHYLRKVEARPIGYFQDGKFYEGIKFLPMIKDTAELLKESQISQIYSNSKSGNFIIGEMLKEGLPISLPWDKLFNSHIGIFGNTGSGKSNTLAKLYTVLFSEKKESISGTSSFVILDFNGEYTGDQLVDSEYKTTFKLNTRTGLDKFPLHATEFWNTELLSILFQATSNTQRPFINRVINGKNKYQENLNSLRTYFRSTFKAGFSAAAPKPEILDLFRSISKTLKDGPLTDALKEMYWHSQQKKFGGPPNNYYDADGATYTRELEPIVNQVQLDSISSFDELLIRINLQLIRDLINGYVQFEHIQPLLKRIESSLSSLENVITTEDSHSFNMVTVISLRDCNQEMKKVLPLLIAKHFYHLHKSTVLNPPDKTMHLIIDEAHNILSQQSSNEHESWKDHRLELFEEIIKEGRKFGIFLTLSSQRPADISPTIVSQLHNFFIHKLVNDRDLFLLDNTLSTLDSLSRSLIPDLSKGSCIATGSAFDLPMTLQIHHLPKEKQPDSEDVNLENLWS